MFARRRRAGLSWSWPRHLDQPASIAAGGALPTRLTRVNDGKCAKEAPRSLARSPTDGHNFSLVDLNQPRSCPRAGQGRAGRAVALTRTGWLRFELRQRAARLHDRSLIDVSLGGGHAGVGAGAPRVDTSLSTVVANCHPSPPSSLPSQYKKNSERGFQEQFEERACDNDLI